MFIEIKYTEKQLGSAKSNAKVYRVRKEKYYSNVLIDYDKYIQHYQFVRNIINGVDGNISLFLMPNKNESINSDYERCIQSVKNISDFAIMRIFWEDLLQEMPDSEISDKYFRYISIAQLNQPDCPR